MIRRMPDGTAYFASMTEKRPRASNEPTYIDLTTDDDGDKINNDLNQERPRKRQKSATPTTTINSLQDNAKPIITKHINNIFSAPSTSNQQNEQIHATITSVNSLPWKNGPSWQLPPKSAFLTSKGSSKLSTSTKPPAGWTQSDDKLLSSLSLGRKAYGNTGVQDFHRPERSLNAVAALINHDDNEQERESMVAQFKLHTRAPLQFNPNNPISEQVRKAPGNAGHQHITSQAREHSRVVQDNRSSERSSKSVNARISEGKSSRPVSNVSINIPLRSTPPARTPSLNTVVSTSVRGPGLGPAKAPQNRKFLVNVPLVGEAKWKQERKALQERLKQGSEYAKEHVEDIERYLGVTGLSAAFPDDLDIERYQNAAQPKKRKVDRPRKRLIMGRIQPEMATSKSFVGEFVHPKEQVRATLTARFAEPLNPPLSFSNTVNDRRLNGKFQFVSDYILRKGVKTTGPIGQPECTCVAGCGISCTCLQKKFNERTRLEVIKQVPQYERHPSGLTVLRDDFIKQHAIVAHSDRDESISENRPLQQRVEISECSEQCSCDNSCVNRVVQKGRTVPLEIFETGRCGFGVRSAMDLVRGQFIEVYLGEVITENELDHREAAAEAGSTSYIYSLDWFSSQQVYHIDGERFGSAMRFVNHSCDPNAGTFPVLNNKSTKQLHYVAFFALKNISAGTEITIDYTPQAAGQMYELKAADEGMEQCHCGSRNCRRMLWLPGKERKARKKTIGKVVD